MSRCRARFAFNSDGSLLINVNVKNEFSATSGKFHANVESFPLKTLTQSYFLLYYMASKPYVANQ